MKSDNKGTYFKTLAEQAALPLRPSARIGDRIVITDAGALDVKEFVLIRDPATGRPTPHALGV